MSSNESIAKKPLKIQVLSTLDIYIMTLHKSKYWIASTNPILYDILNKKLKMSTCPLKSCSRIIHPMIYNPLNLSIDDSTHKYLCVPQHYMVLTTFP